MSCHRYSYGVVHGACSFFFLSCLSWLPHFSLYACAGTVPPKSRNDLLMRSWIGYISPRILWHQPLAPLAKGDWCCVRHGPAAQHWRCAPCYLCDPYKVMAGVLWGIVIFIFTCYCLVCLHIFCTPCTSCRALSDAQTTLSFLFQCIWLWTRWTLSLALETKDASLQWMFFWSCLHLGFAM